MTKVRCWSSALLRVCGVVMLGLALAACFGETHTPATQEQLRALPYTFALERPFAAYNVGKWRVLLRAEKAENATVTPTIEIEVHTEIKSGEFPPENLLLDPWTELQSFRDLVIVEPAWSQLAGKPAVFIRGIATNESGGRKVRMEQKVSKLPQGYARVLAFAEEDEFEQLRPVIELIMASIRVKDR